MKTKLYDSHVALNAKMVDFAGYEMPIHYGSQIEEHHAVRKECGIFDVSHMQVLDLTGSETFSFLQYMLANDVAKIRPGRALYTCMLNEAGGIIDDLIVYQTGHDDYRIVVNAGTKQKDIAWFEKNAKDFSIKLTPRNDLCIVALQGPAMAQVAAQILSKDAYGKAMEMTPFHLFFDDELMIARTGYTGEDGFEFILPQSDVEVFWERLIVAGATPCGLGARDTLRLEAGLNLYGSDMTEETTPLESNLRWTVAMRDDRDFIGRPALEAQKLDGISEKLVGLVLEGKGVLRGHQKVILDSGEVGEITSGTFSPTLGHAIAMARVPASIGEHAKVEIRSKQLDVRVVKPMFVKLGEKLV